MSFRDRLCRTYSGTCYDQQIGYQPDQIWNLHWKLQVCGFDWWTVTTVNGTESLLWKLYFRLKTRTWCWSPLHRSDTCHPPQELQVNGTAVPYIQPFAQQMGMANGGKVGGGVNGKYNEMARMAMSHPAFLNQVIWTKMFFFCIWKYPLHSPNR